MLLTTVTEKQLFVKNLVLDFLGTKDIIKTAQKRRKEDFLNEKDY